MPRARPLIRQLSGFWLLALALALPGCGGDEPDAVDAPSGELIAYSAGDGIHLVTPDGRRDSKVSGTGDLSGPRWAPDGRRFVAVDLSDCCKVYSVSLDGSEKKELPANSSSTPDLSPDGKRLVVFDESDARLHILGARDGRSEGVISKSGNEAAWSPDGGTIAFQGNDSKDVLRIFLVSPRGGELRRLTHASGGTEGEVGAAWSRDGRWIAFSSDQDGDFDIYVIHPDGSGLRKLTDNAIDDGNPSWSPDGSRLVFDRTSTDRSEIVHHDLKTAKEATVASGGYDFGDLVFDPSWRPFW